MAYNRILLFLICCIFNIGAFAKLKDPTKPLNYSGSVISNKAESAVVSLKLSAIFISTHSRHATINGITAKEGQLISSSVKVIKIDKTSVEVLHKGINQTLHLLTPFKKKQVDQKKSYRNE